VTPSDDSPTAEYIDVLASEDLPLATPTVVFAGFRRILLYRSETRIHAVSDLCPHAMQPLCGGQITAGVIRCPKHGARFDLESGKPLNGVTDRSLTLYLVRVRAGRIEVAITGTPFSG
jgi:3-phenylpropionate/trans-cinnamate dioxygenase ferredoxin subunit